MSNPSQGQSGQADQYPEMPLRQIIVANTKAEIDEMAEEQTAL